MDNFTDANFQVAVAGSGSLKTQLWLCPFSSYYPKSALSFSLEPLLTAYESFSTYYKARITRMSRLLALGASQSCESCNLPRGRTHRFQVGVLSR